MYSVHNDTLASSSRHVIDDYWSVSLGTCSFPTSDLRSVDRWCTTTPPISLIPPPRNFTLSDGFAPLNRSVSRYSNIVPRRTQIRLGVWSDGCNQVISAACPDVQAFLTCAREDMTLPVAPSERVFALAALEVFYRVDDPVHWMFWNEKKKDETAEVVNRISRTCNLSVCTWPIPLNLFSHQFIAHHLFSPVWHGMGCLNTSSSWLVFMGLRHHLCMKTRIGIRS